VVRRGARVGKPVHVVAESDLCDARLLRHPEAGGYGLDGQWADDFHHAIHVALTGERDGYYADYRGPGGPRRQLRDRYARRPLLPLPRPHGGPSGAGRALRPLRRLRAEPRPGRQPAGRRPPHALVDLEGAKLAAAAVLTSPFVPMLFMGEEHADPAPFQFFTSHSDPDVVAAVTEGRREEFAAFEAWAGPPPSRRTRPPSDAPDRPRPARPRAGTPSSTPCTGSWCRCVGELPLLADPAAPDVEASMVPGREAVVLRRGTAVSRYSSC
jgi:maltooligosyltrehalose trehalohydrolase